MISDAVKAAQWPVVALALNLDDSRAGHVSPEARRVLTVSTSAFTLCFAVWVMFAIVGLSIRKELSLGEGQFALLAAIPVLTGSILRVPVGILADRIGGRLSMIAVLLATSVPTFLVSRIDGSDPAAAYDQLLVLAAFIGLAGSSFAVGVSWVSAWYPPAHKGFALGVFGTGNVGASITKLFAPLLVTLVSAGGVAGGVIAGGWRFVPAVYGGALVAMAFVVFMATPRADRRPARGRTLVEMLAPLARMRVWRFGFYYVAVFGAYVALALWLPKYYVDVYGLELHRAGLMTALFIFPASLLRPLGGSLSDRFGPRPVTFASLTGIAAFSAVLCLPMGIVPFAAFTCAVGVAMGVGKASVYTYIPQFFPRDVGAVGGLVGAIGGIGGFALPLLFAAAKTRTGSPESVFLVMLVMAVASLLVLGTVVSRSRSGRRTAVVPQGATT